MLERDITSTRWRDYVDIVQLARQGIDHEELLRSARAVAQHRGVTLEPVAAPGRLRRSRTSEMGRMAAQGTPQIRLRGKLGDQIALVTFYINSVFAHGPE